MLLNENIKSALKEKLLLIIHHHADVDSVGSAIALKTVFPDAEILLQMESVPMVKTLLK